MILHLLLFYYGPWVSVLKYHFISIVVERYFFILARFETLYLVNIPCCAYYIGEHIIFKKYIAVTVRHFEPERFRPLAFVFYKLQRAAPRNGEQLQRQYENHQAYI